MSEPVIHSSEGLAAAPLVRTDEAPLLSRTTFLVAATKAAGFNWFPLMSREKPGLATCFSDVTEEIPVVNQVCSQCNGSGEEAIDGKGTLSQCSACEGHGGKSAANEIAIRRTVTWQFLAEHEGRAGLGVNGEKLSPGEFWKRVLDPVWTATHPNTPIAAISRAYHAGEDSMKPSARINQIEAVVLAEMPKGNNRKMVEEAIRIYRGLCFKLQSRESHPIYKEPLIRHILIRRGRDKAYIPYHFTPEQRNRELQRLGMS